MSLYSLLISVLRPDDSVWGRRKLTGRQKMRVSLYRWLLKRGLKAYRNLAVFDVVSAAGGRIKVTHEYRDLEFEAKLKKAKLTLPLLYKSALFPFETRVRRRRFGWRWFSFTDTLVVEIDRKKVCVEHGDLCKAFGSEGDVNVKRTGPQGGVDAAFFAMAVSLAKSTAKKTSSQPMLPAATPKSASPKPKKPAVKPGLMGVDGRGMFGKKPLPEFKPEVPEFKPEAPEVPAQGPSKEPPVIIRKGGVDIDTSF